MVLLAGAPFIACVLGFVDTLQPSAMSVLRSGVRSDRGLGVLSTARTVGTFVGKLVTGLLYGIEASVAHGSAATVAAFAGAVVRRAADHPGGAARRSRPKRGSARCTTCCATLRPVARGSTRGCDRGLVRDVNEPLLRCPRVPDHGRPHTRRSEGAPARTRRRLGEEHGDR